MSDNNVMPQVIAIRVMCDINQNKSGSIVIKAGVFNPDPNNGTLLAEANIWVQRGMNPAEMLEKITEQLKNQFGRIYVPPGA